MPLANDRWPRTMLVCAHDILTKIKKKILSLPLKK